MDLASEHSRPFSIYVIEHPNRRHNDSLSPPIHFRYEKQQAILAALSARNARRACSAKPVRRPLTGSVSNKSVPIADRDFFNLSTSQNCQTVYKERSSAVRRSASSVSEPLNRMIRCAHIKSKTDHTECFVPVSVTSTVSPGKMNCTVLYRPVQYSHEDCLVYGF